MEEALARVLASAEAPLGEERVALDEALGRVLARDLTALRTQPPFPNSAMDGYALRAADAASASASLRVVGEAAAGRAFEGAVGPGEAVRIFTGRRCRRARTRSSCRRTSAATATGSRSRRPRRPAATCVREGLDFREGETLIRAGRRLGPRDIALAAAANHAEVAVRRSARVAIPTGDELVAPGEPIGPSQIVASNNFTVAGIVEACGGIPIDLGIARDCWPRSTPRSAPGSTRRRTCSSRSAARRSATTLEVYAECTETGIWPSGGEEIQLISLPRWAR